MPGNGSKGYTIDGTGGETAYPAESAPTKKHGGSSAIHDGIVSHEDPVKPMRKDDGTPAAESPRSV